MRYYLWLWLWLSLLASPRGAQAGGALTCFADERQAFRRSVSSLLAAERFDELESKAEALRHGKPRFSSGAPVLFDFYEGLNPVSDHVARNERQRYHGLLEKWMAQRPTSLTPRIPLIREQMALAWESRGEGWAGTVTTDGWTGFEARSTEGWRLGNEALRMKLQDPALYDVLLALGVGLDKPRSELESLFAKGIALDPGFDHLYVVMSRYLMPRWHGTPQEFERLASRAASVTKGTLGDGLYARVAAEGLLLYGGGDFTTLSPALPWGRLKGAFADLDRAFPDSSLIVNVFCALALRYGDVATARSLFERIDGHWSADSSDVWRSRARFEAARARADKPRP